MDKARYPSFPWPVSGRAILKAQPSDFVVTEELGFEPSGRGEHLFFWIEKTRISTHEVAAELADWLNLPRRAVSYSGRKDKHAVCRQWFSAHRPGIDRPRIPEQPHWRVIEVSRNTRHLKVGTHRGNRFDVRLGVVQADPDRLRAGFDRLLEMGCQNYFGRQRFGFDNLERALRGGQDEMALAAARAALFNLMLSSRVEQNTWLAPVAGDPCLRPGGNGWLMEATEGMIAQGAADPSMPLFGPLPGLAASAAEHWRQEFAAHPDLVRVLEPTSWQPHRRRVRLMPQHAALEIHGEQIRIQATLPTGAFMTTVLDGLIETHDANSD